MIRLNEARRLTMLMSTFIKNALSLLFAPLLGMHAVSVSALELTRFGPEKYSNDSLGQKDHNSSFFGVKGKANLHILLENDNGLTTAMARVKIVLNEQVVDLNGFKPDANKLVIPVKLVEDNSLQVQLSGNATTPITVRIKQEVDEKDIQLSITSRIHFNVNASNFERSRSFYRLLGFSDSTKYPPTNTLEVAQALGIDHKYVLQVELLFRSGFSGGFIDLIEWTTPRDISPPYPHLYHLGISRATILTTDLDADMGYLKSHDIEFLSQAVERSDGSRFAILKDPDGTYFELLETGEQSRKSLETVNVIGLREVNINVSDMERSHAFYQMLGFSGQVGELETGDANIAKAMGVESSYSYRGAFMRHHRDGSAVELTEWHAPRDNTPPFPVPINHLGIHRIAYSTDDLDGDVSKLKAQGVKFVSDPVPCCTGPDSKSTIVVFADPDGTFIELVGL